MCLAILMVVDEEIKLQRGGEKGTSPRYRCKHAEQSADENLQKFRDMRDGKYKPREAFLRMKQDVRYPPLPIRSKLICSDHRRQPANVGSCCLPGARQTPSQDRVEVEDLPFLRFHSLVHSYLVLFQLLTPIDCLCDSFEGITHSLCTVEFFLSRTSYEWLNKELVEFQPMQREYGRLSLSGSLMSKRKLKELVEKNIVRGWDDPRLSTLIAVRRKGVPPGAILEFVNELGVTTTNSIIQASRFDQTIRRYLERTVPRLMLVLDPVPVVIEDADEFEGTELTAPFSPKNPAMGEHKIKFTKTVYIDRSDFREVDSKDYFRLAPGKSVGLLQAPFPIKATSFTKDEATGQVTEIRAVFDRETKKPKTFIQWVPAGEGSGSRKCEVRLYNPLFKSENPSAAEGGFLNDLNPESEVVYPNAVIESGFDEVKARAPWPEAAGEDKLGKGGPESVRFQGMRVAYFVS